MTDIYSKTDNDAVSAEELRLYRLIMDYRDENGLDPIPMSKSLTLVAGRHAVDSYDNIFTAGLELPPGSNLHSWSDAPYPDDASKPEVMWEAPERLGTPYPGSGFEISAAGFTDVAAALVGWQGSPGHDTVIVNEGVWASTTWNAIGVGVELHDDETYFHVWFGREEGPAGPPKILGARTADAIAGTVFDDHLVGRGGDDRLRGAGGDDTLRGNSGADQLKGQGGEDLLIGGGGGDALHGGGASDEARGGGGDDRVRGNAGGDELRGDAGDDTLLGGVGRDTLDGGAGDDLLTSGRGRDLLIFDGAGHGTDRVTDYESFDTLRFDNATSLVVSVEGDGTRITHDGGEVFVDNASLLESDLLLT